jgi:hypothetical protein
MNPSKSTLKIFLILKGLIEIPLSKDLALPERNFLSNVKSNSPLRFDTQRPGATF